MGETPDIASMMRMMNSMSSGSFLDQLASFQKKQKEQQTSHFVNESHAASPLAHATPSQNASQDSSTVGNETSIPDMETLMKIMRMVSAMQTNQNDASTNLLNSLKPFLRESKQDKIEQYIKLLKLSHVISEFNHLGGEEK